MTRTYAVGDIHGCIDKLRSLLARCQDEAASRLAKFVFLGDYIDRGPDSHGVIELLMTLERRGDVVCLMGNHEAIALDAIDGRVNPDNWLTQGGDATLHSYGVSDMRALPAPHVAWIRELPRSHDDGRRFFVHAGINPDRPLDNQDSEDLIWMREPFLSDRRDHGRLIVHGHTPLRIGTPDLQENRLNLDTGAVYGGPLTAAVFDDTQTKPVAFIQAAA